MSRARYPRAYVMPMYAPAPRRRRFPSLGDGLAGLSTLVLMGVLVFGIVAVGGL